MFYTLLSWAIVLYIFLQIIKQLIEYYFPIKLHGKIVVVIGSTTGFGHEFVLRCARQGMTVFAACNSPNGLQKVFDSTSAFAGTVHAHHLDLASRQSVEAFFQFVNTKIGDGQGIDALVNNAGIIRAGPDDWLTLEDYEDVFRVNMFGIIDVTKNFKEKIKMAKGRIVFCSSICGRLAFPFYGPYTMSKFAMEAYGDTIRRELAPFGVHVAIVEPGYFRTPITDPNHIPSKMESAFRQAPPSIQEQYGEQFLAKIKALAYAHLASAANSSRIDWVIDVYFHACTSRFPRKRYVVGLDANWIVVPIARLPAEIQDFAFWLNSLILGAPIPNTLKPKSTEKMEEN